MKLGVCNHYNGPVTNRACRAGVDYNEILGKPGLVFIKKIPCLAKNVMSAMCDKAQFPTQAEVDEFNKDTVERLYFVDESCRLCTEHAHANGFPFHGEVICPKCGGKLKYSTAAQNGHIWAKCTTEGCLAWVQ